MLTFPKEFTPWWLCTPSNWVPYQKSYFLGKYQDPREGLLDVCVYKSWSVKNERPLRDSTGCSWLIEEMYSVTESDKGYVRFKFLNDFVKDHWWEIVTGAPTYG